MSVPRAGGSGVHWSIGRALALPQQGQFAQLYKTFGSKPELVERIASCLNEANGSFGGEGFINLAKTLPGEEPELILELFKMCKGKVELFDKIFQVFKKNIELADTVSSYIGNNVSAGDWISLAQKHNAPILDLFEEVYPEEKEKVLLQETMKIDPHYLLDMRSKGIALEKALGVYLVFDAFQEKHPLSFDKWSHYVVRKEGFAEQLSYCSEAQQLYGALMHQSVQMALSAAESCQWNPRQRFFFLMLRRQAIAQQCQHPNPNAYGVRRIESYEYTPLGVGYSHLSQKLLRLFSQGTGSEKIVIECVQKAKQLWQFELPENASTFQAMTFYEAIDGRLIQLESVFILQERVDSKHFVFDEQINAAICVQHTPPEKINIILNYLDKLEQQYHRCQDAKSSIKILAQMFWWGCRAKPVIRGDPSIFEMDFKILGAMKGIQFPPWKIGIIPWEAVVSEPSVKRFADDFVHLFDNSQPDRFERRCVTDFVLLQVHRDHRDQVRPLRRLGLRRIGDLGRVTVLTALVSTIVGLAAVFVFGALRREVSLAARRTQTRLGFHAAHDFFEITQRQVEVQVELADVVVVVGVYAIIAGVERVDHARPDLAPAAVLTTNNLDVVEPLGVLGEDLRRLVRRAVVHDHPSGRRHGLRRHAVERAPHVARLVPTRRDQAVASAGGLTHRCTTSSP